MGHLDLVQREAPGSKEELCGFEEQETIYLLHNRPALEIRFCFHLFRGTAITAYLLRCLSRFGQVCLFAGQNEKTLGTGISNTLKRHRTNIWMVDLGKEANFGRRHWVFFG